MTWNTSSGSRCLTLEEKKLFVVAILGIIDDSLENENGELEPFVEPFNRLSSPQKWSVLLDLCKVSESPEGTL